MERELQELPPEERYTQRLKRSKPVMDGCEGPGKENAHQHDQRHQQSGQAAFSTLFRIDPLGEADHLHGGNHKDRQWEESLSDPGESASQQAGGRVG